MEFITREITSTNWITILIIGTLLLLAIAKKINAVWFSDFLMLLTSNKYIISSQKTNRLSSFFNIVLIVFQVLSVSLFLYLCLGVFDIEVESYGMILYFKITIIYTVIVVCKILIEKIVGAIFSIDTIIDEYLFYKVSYRNFIGVVLLPINIIFIYALLPFQTVFLILLIVLVVLNSIVLISFYKKNENIILNYLFYFILYLCALEIAPYFILYKLIS